jgi:Prenyltransferase and squalene oxidase repeat
MSWQLASFAIVLASLGAAFWWYERGRPSAKLLAVVATLAALAALGRDAFVAVPDVKPITAIVFVSGLALGARPGFAVGAISALASNVLLGQGPWTPWQMLGWGLVGLLGAGLGWLLGERRPSALVLAIACALSAEAFNLVVDLYTLTGTGNHSAGGFLVVLGAASAFDITHVVASFGFGLLFGPTLLSMLLRVRARLEVRWEQPAEATAAIGAPPRGPRAGPALMALMVALCVPALALSACARAGATQGRSQTRPQAPVAHTSRSPAVAAKLAIGSELSFLARAQDSDGGFGAAPGQASSELYSAWAAIGMAAAGRNPLSVRRDGHSVLDALRGEAAGLEGAGDLERTILALRACGVSVHSLPGGDPVKRLLRLQDADGSFEHLANLSAFGVLALRAAGYASNSGHLASAAAWLARQQDADGGFGFGPRGGGSDVDDTAAAMQALAVAGPAWRPKIARAASFLAGSQDRDGGFPQERGGSSNVQSTAWAIQGLIAAGRDVQTMKRSGSPSPVAYIEGLVAANGSVRYSKTGSQTPVWVTAQALTALAGRPLPVLSPR